MVRKLTSSVVTEAREKAKIGQGPLVRWRAVLRGSVLGDVQRCYIQWCLYEYMRMRIAQERERCDSTSKNPERSAQLGANHSIASDKT